MSEEGLDALYREQHRRVVRLAFLLTSHSGLAEEIAQEAFVRVWRSWERIRDHDAAAAYLRTTVVNLCRSALRRRALEMRHLVCRGEDAVEVDAATGVDVLRALGEVPARQRACVVLRYYEDLTEAETARLLGISVGTVKSQTHKALRKLQDLLDGDEDGS